MPLARRATISLSLASRPKASSTPIRNAMGIVTEKMLGSRKARARNTVYRSAPRDTSTFIRWVIWSRSRMKVKRSRPRAVGGQISRATYRSRIVGRSQRSSVTGKS
jgi:hypothetical protein